MEKQPPPDSPFGLVSLLRRRGISALGNAEAAGALDWFPGRSRPPGWPSPPLASWWCPRWGGLSTWPHPLPQRKPEGGSQNSIFSLNLVEKLQQLGLDKVVARGEASYATLQLQGFHPRKRDLW
ncbi:hypothetical protein JRQ81_005154 [Phrynocephalus forsythii]|uniref:Uncharacterized protein n=1 Tax=Phrynocephalus forsythii TaxID=171643 RepID=A0A9Q0XG08_9SAUR|nr:hypothetical protein JRQ81_005154 [Phrynocephalus forsythii]